MFKIKRINISMLFMLVLFFILSFMFIPDRGLAEAQKLEKEKLTIGVVGPCGTGKSELVNRLNQYGYPARHIAQEHSYVPRMWKQLSNPDILVFLKVSYEMTLKRKNFNWSEKEYQEQGEW